MKGLKALGVALLVTLFAVGCSYPPSYQYIEEPLPPAKHGTYEIEVAVGTAVPVVLIANDHSKFDGANGANGARTKDESIAIIVRSTREGSVHHGAPMETGPIFVIYGITPGKTSIEVFLDGEDKGTLALTVVPQR